jgi:hypothetical protein
MSTMKPCQAVGIYTDIIDEGIKRAAELYSPGRFSRV